MKGHIKRASKKKKNEEGYVASKEAMKYVKKSRRLRKINEDWVKSVNITKMKIAQVIHSEMVHP